MLLFTLVNLTGVKRATRIAIPMAFASAALAVLAAVVPVLAGSVDWHRDPGLLRLEITESVLMDPAEASIERVAALKRLGVGIVLDDFGTGYSSLGYVKRFPIDTLKIDRSFVRGMTAMTPDASIVEAVIAMARGLKLGVIAEGVETPEQAELLVRMGCTRCQGYLFSAPVGAEEIDRILAGPGEEWWPQPAELATARQA